MRKVIVSNIMSLDGYHEGPGKNVMDVFNYRFAYPTDESFDLFNVEQLRAADTLLLGRASYDMFRGYWPPVMDDPAASTATREISRLNNAIQKVVISDSLTPEQTEPWRQTTRIVRRAEALQQVAGLKRQAGKDILIFGSRTLWNDLLANGLVDELNLMIAPVVLGAGTPLFAAGVPDSLRLIDSRAWDGAGTVQVRYAVHRE